MARAMIRRMAGPSTARANVVSRRARALLLALTLPGFFAGIAVAQTKPGVPAPKGRPTSRATTPKRGTAVDAAATASATSTPTLTGTGTGTGTGAGYVVPPTAPVPTTTAGDVVESKTLDGGTHVFKFSELDIEGRLKSPQLVYFLRRVRAEFTAGDLGHRSFMREMSETRKESSF